jgi:H+/Cl- antiporter ClcA
VTDAEQPAAVSPPDRPPSELTAEQADATIASRRYVILLIIVSVVGVVVSLAAWCFLEGTYQLQQEFYVHLPHALGYNSGPPKWWPLPVLVLGALVTGLAIRHLPGDGGHIPADGLSTKGPAGPEVLPGVILAGAATIGSGLVLGPEAPLIAIGAGLGALTIKLSRRETPPQLLMIVSAAGSFAALSFIFDSPMIAAVILIEATGLGGPRLRVVLVPGLLASAIGTLVSLGLGHFTGLSTSAYALGVLPLDKMARPTISEFGWTIGIGLAIAGVTSLVMRSGGVTHRFVSQRRMVVLLLVIALIIGGLAILFSQITGHGTDEVLFSGQDQIDGLVGNAAGWSVAALVWLLLFKGIAYGLSLGAYRGGPTFPALFLGAAAGIMASHLPGYPIQAGVAVGIGAATVAVLRLPLSAVVLATLLAAHASPNVEPLVIVGVVTAYVTTLAIGRRKQTESPAS